MAIHAVDGARRSGVLAVVVVARDDAAAGADAAVRRGPLAVHDDDVTGGNRRDAVPERVRLEVVPECGAVVNDGVVPPAAWTTPGCAPNIRDAKYRKRAALAAPATTHPQ